MDSYRASTVDVPECSISSSARVRAISSDITPCIVMKNNGVLYHQVPHIVPVNSCVPQHRAPSILIQERFSSFVKMVLGRSHYPYESQCSIHCKYTKFSGTTILMSTNACAFANLWLAKLNRNCVMYPSAIGTKCVWHMHLLSTVKTLRCRVLLLVWGKRICLNINL